ncbi:MAG: ABC transporter permease [Candidatus Limnocylindrales bacterium]
MFTLINAEILKLRTVRWPWVLLAAQLALVAAGISGYAIASGSKPIEIQTALAHVGLTSMLGLVLGIMAVAGEYRDHTITDTFLATPRRSQVIVAKVVTFTTLGFLFAVLTALVAVAVTALWLSARGSSLDVSSGVVWRTLVGAVLWDAGFTAIGVGMGACLPNLTGAITAGLVWIALVEGIVASIVGSDLARWLPVAAGRALENVPTAGLLAPWAGGLVLAAYAIGFAVLAVAVTVRRDVT